MVILHMMPWPDTTLESAVCCGWPGALLRTPTSSCSSSILLEWCPARVQPYIR